MKLAQGERTIKEWTYATIGSAKKTLSVTNKRLVHKTTTEDTVNQYEIPLRNVDSVAFNSKTITIGGSAFLVILGVILMLAGVVLMIALGERTPTMIGFGIVGIVIGLVCLIFGLKKRQQTLFGLAIYTTSGIAFKEGESNAKKDVVDSIMDYDDNAISDIIDSIGAIIEEARGGTSVSAAVAYTTDSEKELDEKDYSYLD